MVLDPGFVGGAMLLSTYLLLVLWSINLPRGCRVKPSPSPYKQGMEPTKEALQDLGARWRRAEAEADAISTELINTYMPLVKARLQDSDVDGARELVRGIPSGSVAWAFAMDMLRQHEKGESATSPNPSV
jgi:hypothetical protein